MLSAATLLALAGCPAKPTGDAGKGGAATEMKPADGGKTGAEAVPVDAAVFVKDNDARLRELWVDAETKLWNQQTNITDANEKAASEAHERVMAYESTAIAQAAKLLGEAKTDSDRRQLELMTRVATLPAPNDAEKRKALAGLASEMESIYGKGSTARRRGTPRPARTSARCPTCSRTAGTLPSCSRPGRGGGPSPGGRCERIT